MTDIFLKEIPDEYLDKIFATMALCPNITFQILTKRAERMRDYFLNRKFRKVNIAENTVELSRDFYTINQPEPPKDIKRTPLPNVHLGVSAENQKTADERIPLLLETPAAVRFLSCEPLLGEIDLVDPIVADSWEYADQMHYGEWDYLGHAFVDSGERINGFTFCKTCGNRMPNPMHNNQPNKQFSEIAYIDWVILGGESGNGARPCEISHLRSIVEQCKAANIPTFIKQLGTKPTLGGTEYLRIKDRKGGTIEEFPEDLRIREFPAV